MDVVQTAEVEELWKRLFEQDRQLAEWNGRMERAETEFLEKENALLSRVRKLKRRIARRDRIIVQAMTGERGWNK